MINNTKLVKPLMQKTDTAFNLQIGINYLINCIRKDGSFTYEINSATGEISNSYNILRHAGCLYILYQWLNLSVNKDDFFLLEPAATFLTDQIKPLMNNTDLICVVERNEAKLGGSALALLALTEKYKTQSSLEQLNIMKGLAGFIISMQEESGKFKSKLLYSENIIANFESTYYPGEAILALIQLYKINLDPDLLTSAELGINYLIKNPVLNHDGTHGHNHWLAIALAEYYLLANDSNAYNELVLIINSTIKSMNDNYRAGNNNYIYSATEMSTRGEAILALLNLECKLNTNTDIKRLTNVMDEIIDFCLKFQIKTDVLYANLNLKGGIKRGAGNAKIRIDYVQHLMQVLLLYNTNALSVA